MPLKRLHLCQNKFRWSEGNSNNGLNSDQRLFNPATEVQHGLAEIRNQNYKDQFSLTLESKEKKKQDKLSHTLKLEQQAVALMNMVQELFLATHETLAKNEIQSKHEFQWEQDVQERYIRKVSLQVTCSLSKKTYRHGYELPLRLTGVVGIFFDIKPPIAGIPPRKAIGHKTSGGEINAQLYQNSLAGLLFRRKNGCKCNNWKVGISPEGIPQSLFN